ncbi:MAG: DUF4097 family beta strand repeat protein [Bacilli bacterium]|nr:DUF4097 family beta strand repeat protein [Bacilli bacterium]
MTINEFLITLEEELKYLPKKKRQVIINIYCEKINVEIDLGTSEDKIADMFPAPSLIAKDIYEKEGINYLERRRKKLKSDDIFRMIICSIAMLFTISAAIVLTGYIGYSIYKLIYLVTLMRNAKDIILTIQLVVCLIFTIILVYFYLIDIFILLFNFLLDIILRPFNKTLNFRDFSIIEAIEEKIAKPKMFKKVLIGFLIATVFFGLTNYCLQSYFYRSYNQEKPNLYEQVLDMDEYQPLSSIEFEIDEAEVYVKKGEALSIKIFSEFERKIYISNEEGKIIITNDKIKTFDLFNFLKEPKPVFEITIPNDVKLSFTQDNGILQLENIDTTYMYAKMYQGNLILKDTNIKESIIKTSNAGVNMLNTNIDILDLDSNSGTIKLENAVSTNATINNISTSVNMLNVQFDNLSVTSSKGDLIVDGIISKDISVEAGTGEIEFKNVNCSNKISAIGTSSSNIAIGKANAGLIEATAVSGDIVFHEVKAKSVLKTGANAIVNKCSGEYDITCFGNFLTIQECHFSNALINAQKTEVSMKYISADYLEYNGNDSMSTLYFVFGKSLKIEDYAGKLHFDNDKVIITSDSDLKLFDEYYSKIEQLIISPNATYRVENGTKIGE